MPQLDENSIEIVKRFEEEHRGDYGHSLLKALKLTAGGTFINFSGAQIETRTNIINDEEDKEYYLVCYDKLNWNSNELDEVRENIGDHKLLKIIESNGKYHKFYFRVPSYDEVRNGLRYFRNVYGFSDYKNDYAEFDSD